MRSGYAALALLLLASLLVAQANPPPAQQPAAPKQPTAADFPYGFDSNPYLVSGGDTPILGFNVAHGHMLHVCYGLLFISRDSIRYVVLQPAGGRDSFQFARSDLEAARPWQPFIAVDVHLTHATELKFRNGRTYHFYMVRPGALRASPARGDLVPSSEIVDTINNFDATVARLAPKPPPAPPVITLIEPAGADDPQGVEAGVSLRVRGIASHASGIAAVTVNGQPAALTTHTAQTVEFLVPALALAPGSSSVLVLASATDKSKSHRAFTVLRPEVKVTAPGAPFPEATVAVRGVASGFRGLDRVEVAGQRATLTPQPDGSVHFEVAAVPVPVGESVLQGSAVGTSGRAEAFTIAVKRLPPPGPPALGLKEVLDALNSQVPKPRLVALINQYGVDFELNDEAERQLRAAGADSDLLLAIAKAKK